MKNRKRDYYQVLGLHPNATEQEIKSAYRKKALEHHPDRNPDNRHEAEEKFKEAAEAYSVLSDQAKRAAYDRYGHAGVGAAGFDPSAFQGFEDLFASFGGLEDFFGDFFGLGSRSRRSNRGSDLRYDLEISFEEAVFGMDAQIKVPRLETCLSCGGTGARSGTSAVTCPTCAGRGQVRYQQGFFSFIRPCTACRGSGQVIRERCPNCRGEGRVRQEKTLKVHIPPGVDAGTRLRIAGEGEAGRNGAPPGDLYVVLGVQDHPFFQRHDQDLVCTVPISFCQAALGSELRVPTLDGEETLKVPEGTQTGTVFRIRGRGVPALNARGRGDLYVKVQVRTPTHLTKEQRKLLEQMAEAFPEDNRPTEKSVLEKVKDYFTG